MSRVEPLKQQIFELHQDELRALRHWFIGIEAELWDRQFESDARNGKLANLAEQALLDHEAGRSQAI